MFNFLIGFLISAFIGFVLSIKIIIEEIFNPIFLESEDEWLYWVCVFIVILYCVALGIFWSLI